MVGLQSRSRCEHPARAGAGRRAVRPRCQSSKSRTGVFRGVVSGFRYYNPSTGRWLSRDPIAELGFDPTGYYQRKMRAATAEQFTSMASKKVLRVKTRDIDTIASLLATAESDDHWGEKEELNLFGFVQNDGVNKYDSFGLYETRAANCSIERRLGRGMCWWVCTCPSGYTMWPNSSVDISPCSRPASRTCYRLDCWDYVAGGCAVLVVTVVVVGSGGTALVFACAPAL